MFHQIKVLFQDQDALTFIWRSNANLLVEEFIMLAYLSGKKDSLFSANFILRKSATDNQKNFKERVQFLISKIAKPLFRRSNRI